MLPVFYKTLIIGQVNYLIAETTNENQAFKYFMPTMINILSHTMVLIGQYMSKVIISANNKAP